MPTVTSQDGTKIAFDKVGSGPAVIPVNGAMAYRAFDPRMAHLAELLGQHFTVYNYDRRGRGASSDKEPFAKEREIEDLQALVEDVGGTAMVFGLSSGAVVSLDAAALTPGIPKVGVYEPALIVDDSRQPVPTDYTEHLTRLLSALSCRANRSQLIAGQGNLARAGGRWWCERRLGTPCR